MSNKELSEKICNLVRTTVQDRFDETVRLHENYSGRGMYGRKCLAIVGSQSDCREVLSEAIIDAYRENDPDFEEILKSLIRYSTDSMGRYDVVMYWDDVQVTEKEEEENVEP